MSGGRDDEHALAAAQVSDYGSAPSNWAGTGSSSMFGVCLQGVSAQTTVNAGGGWVLDNTTTPGTCTANDTDPWRAVPTAQTKVGQTGSAGQLGRVDLVWGVRMADNQKAGTYAATVLVEALAPAV